MLREWMKYGEGATLPVMIELDLRGGLDLPDRRRAWLVEFADRIEAAGYKSFAEVPAERFDEIARLY
jgi:hypothetical protein